VPAALFVLAVVSLPACDVVFQDTNAAKATDQWKRTYTLAPGGLIDITNVNGPIEVTGSAGDTVDVVADLSATGATDQLAKDLLKAIKIDEQATPDKIRLEVPRTSEDGGFGFGSAGRKTVAFKIAVPKASLVKVTTRNGNIRFTDLAGAVKAESTNGAVIGTGLSGPVNASTTNGSISLHVLAVQPQGIRLDTTNGPIELALPAGAKATISARWVNGGFSTNGLSPQGESDRRHYAGTLNGGGPTIELSTTNGPIRLRSSDTASNQ
jgi:DUF4097 and DUF4098 domain-containing protein YvlB